MVGRKNVRQVAGNEEGGAKRKGKIKSESMPEHVDCTRKDTEQSEYLKDI